MTRDGAQARLGGDSDNGANARRLHFLFHAACSSQVHWSNRLDINSRVGDYIDHDDARPGTVLRQV